MAKVSSRCLFLLSPYVLMLLCTSVKSSTFPSTRQVPKFKYKTSSSSLTRLLESREVERQEMQITRSTYRRVLENFHPKTTEHYSIDPPTTLTTTPVTNPVTTPAATPTTANPAPATVTVPAALPSPVPLPETNPLSSPLPVTNPVTTPSANPTTSPNTVYPPPSLGNPAEGNSPAVPGQSWCIARNGAFENQLQSALDYACGIGGADCSTIQQGASCFNPNTLQNHASYAFNSYYQRNPMQTSCDFGGSAVITNINPSSGSCVFPLLSAASSSSSPSPVNPVPTPTTSSSNGAAVPGAATPPPMLNPGSPDMGLTTGVTGSPFPGNSSTSSASTCLQPAISYLMFLTCLVTGSFMLGL